MLILTRSQIAGLLQFEEYVAVVGAAFRAHAEGCSMPPALMHVERARWRVPHQGRRLAHARTVLRAQIQRRLLSQPRTLGMPKIQGMVILANASNGLPLAVMDSMEITIQRTGAATAIAARYLARRESSVVTMCGCGNQGRIQLRAICHALPIRKAFAFGLTLEKSRAFAAAMSGELNIVVEATNDLPSALRQSDVCVTCTPAKKALIFPADVPPGMFLSAVGADSPDKQELDQHLLPLASVYGDLLDQCAEVGEFHHGIERGLVTRQDFRGELGALIAGTVRGRTGADEITIYDSTGTAIQDVAAAVAVYRKAKAAGIGTELDLAT